MFDFILGLRFSYGLPLHVARFVAPTAGERHDVIDDVSPGGAGCLARAGTRMGPPEGIPSSSASHDPSVRGPRQPGISPFRANVRCGCSGSWPTAPPTRLHARLGEMPRGGGQARARVLPKGERTKAAQLTLNTLGVAERTRLLRRTS